MQWKTGSGEKAICRRSRLWSSNRVGRTLLSAPHRLLVRLEVLPIGQVDHVLQHRRAWRQFCRIQECGVEVVVAVWRVIDQGTALESAGGVLRIVQAD